MKNILENIANQNKTEKIEINESDVSFDEVEEFDMA